MNLSAPDILLWLFVINLGITFGAALYETRIILPQWFPKSSSSEFRVNSESICQTDVGLRFWAFVTTMPLSLFTLANLAAALQSHGSRHEWWISAAVITLIERIGTFAFFIPTALKLMRANTLPALTAAKMASRWIRLNHVRNALILFGWLAALKTLSLSE